MSSIDTCPPPRELKPGLKPVDAEWLQWIAENRLRNCTPESMLVTMTQNGFDPIACATAIARMETDPAYLAARKIQQLQYKLESVMANQQKLWELAPNYERVEKRSHVPLHEFMERYVWGSRPLVLTGVAADWPAMKRWSNGPMTICGSPVVGALFVMVDAKVALAIASRASLLGWSSTR